MSTFEAGPMVSIVVPVFNGQRYIASTLQSIFAQSYKNFEVIVVDNNSTDNTLSILAEQSNQFQLNVLSTLENSGGPALPRNIGIESAKGSLICLLDSDDQMEPDKLRLQVEVFKQHPEATLCHTNASVIDEAGETIQASYNNWIKRLLLRSFHPSFLVRLFNPININTVMFRRDALPGKFPVDEDYGGVEDWLFWLEQVNRNHGCFYLVAALTKYRFHKNSLSSRLGTKQLRRGLTGYRQIVMRSPHAYFWVNLQRLLFWLRMIRLQAVLAFTKKSSV